MNNVTVCKKDTCLSVKGNMAGFVAFAIAVGVIAYAVSTIVKLTR